MTAETSNARGEVVAWFPTNGRGEIIRTYGDGSPVYACRTKEEAEQAKRCHLGATGPVIPLYAAPPQPADAEVWRTMNAKTNGALPAHPVIGAPGAPEDYPGLTKRELFAAMAMQGILANRVYDPPRRMRLAGMAEDAVSAADALLAELAKGDNNVRQAG